MSRACWPFALLALLALPAVAKAPCPAPGEPIHWIADWCMQQLETDDEIPASDCIFEASKRRFRSACARSTWFKTRMCERSIADGTRTGTVRACVRDPAFRGRTVERGGVGG